MSQWTKLRGAWAWRQSQEDVGGMECPGTLTSTEKVYHKGWHNCWRYRLGLRYFGDGAGASQQVYASSSLVPLDECGQRHVFLETSPRYTSKESGECASMEDVVRGSNERVGSGAYSVVWSCESPTRVFKLLQRSVMMERLT